MTWGVKTRTVVAALLMAAALIPASAASAEPGVVTEYPIPVETTPYAVATGPEGKIWFVDSGGHATGGTLIGRMTTGGAISTAEVIAFPHPGLGLALALGSDGNMWAEQGERLDKVPLGVSATGQITAYEYPAHSGSNGFGSVAVGPDGRLWVGLTEQLAASTTSGEMQLYETEAGTGVSGVTSGPGGELWFGAGNSIRRIATNGAHSGADVFPLPEGSGINDMALGPDGNMWFTLGSPAAVGKITPAGEITLFRTPTPSSLPFGIAAGPDAHMWFTERNADTVGSIPLTATSGSEIHEYPIAHTNAGLIGIVAGPDNRMWFAESNENRLGAITTAAAPPASGGGTTPPGGLTTTLGSGKRGNLPPNPSPVGCVAEKLSLVDVLARAGTAHLTGVARARTSASGSRSCRAGTAR
jgi:streptogramin lyase